MNENIRRHFHEIEARLIECPVIHAYQIIRKEISLDDGKLRIRSSLIGGGMFECFLYVKDEGARIDLLKYRFHWQDSERNLVRRLDNAPHHGELPFAPHHLHVGDDHVEGLSEKPDLFVFIDEMEKVLVKK